MSPRRTSARHPDLSNTATDVTSTTSLPLRGSHASQAPSSTLSDPVCPEQSHPPAKQVAPSKDPLRRVSHNTKFKSYDRRRRLGKTEKSPLKSEVSTLEASPAANTRGSEESLEENDHVMQEDGNEMQVESRAGAQGNMADEGAMAGGEQKMDTIPEMSIPEEVPAAPDENERTPDANDLGDVSQQTGDSEQKQEGGDDAAEKEVQPDPAAGRDRDMASACMDAAHEVPDDLKKSPQDLEDATMSDTQPVQCTTPRKSRVRSILGEKSRNGLVAGTVAGIEVTLKDSKAGNHVAVGEENVHRIESG